MRTCWGALDHPRLRIPIHCSTLNHRLRQRQASTLQVDLYNHGGLRKLREPAKAGTLSGYSHWTALDCPTLQQIGATHQPQLKKGKEAMQRWLGRASFTSKLLGQSGSPTRACIEQRLRCVGMNSLQVPFGPFLQQKY